MSGHADGMVVVRRTFYTRNKRREYGWTLHRHSCRVALRATNSIPAPADAYPNTVPCHSCKPDGHMMTVEPRPDGSWHGRCDACPIDVVGTTAESARAKGRRLHGKGNPMAVRRIGAVA